MSNFDYELVEKIEKQIEEINNDISLADAKILRDYGMISSSDFEKYARLKADKIIKKLRTNANDTLKTNYKEFEDEHKQSTFNDNNNNNNDFYDKDDKDDKDDYAMFYGENDCYPIRNGEGESGYFYGGKG